MRDMHPPEGRDWDAVEDALRTYPQRPSPSLYPAVMGRIQALAHRPPFRLAWIDYALAVFFAGIAAGLLWPLLASDPATPLLVMPALPLSPSQDILSPVLLLSLALAVAMLLIAAALFERR